MEELKVGDKVYNTKQDGFDDFIRYSFSEVVEVTKTLVILKNGVRLVNQPRISYITESIGYSVSRQRGVHWHLVTLQAIRSAQIENKKIAAYDWFETKKFTLKEKQLIYEQFKEMHQKLED
ncbi:MAG: pyruvate kinase [Cellulophaga sp.]|nr:pyruvate kinase [Cellulophaga sp.]